MFRCYISQGLEFGFLSDLRPMERNMCFEVTKVRIFKDSEKIFKSSIRNMLFL